MLTKQFYLSHYIHLGRTTISDIVRNIRHFCWRGCQQKQNYYFGLHIFSCHLSFLKINASWL